MELLASAKSTEPPQTLQKFITSKWIVLCQPKYFRAATVRST
jgi:hypothetical protein